MSPAGSWNWTAAKVSSEGQLFLLAGPEDQAPRDGEKQESKRRKTLERELEWVRMAPKARQAKQKARLGAYEKLASADVKQKEANLEIYIPNDRTWAQGHSLQRRLQGL
jgi:hypothetical protein